MQVSEFDVFMTCIHVIRRPYWYAKQKQNAARVLHNNRAQFRNDFFAIVQLWRHDHDVGCKTSIQSYAVIFGLVTFRCVSVKEFQS